MNLTISNLHDQISNCTECFSLRPWEKFSSNSHGNFNSKAMIISEAPGGVSFKNGKMWLGNGGIRLRNILRKLDSNLHLEDLFYMTDVVKCHPPNNRDPNQKEIQKCADFLSKEIEIIKPSIIISFGRFALDYLAVHFKSIDKIPSGKITALHSNKGFISIKFRDFEVIPLVHPVAANRFSEKLDYDVYKSHISSIFKKITEINSNLA